MATYMQPYRRKTSLIAQVVAMNAAEAAAAAKKGGKKKPDAERAEVEANNRALAHPKDQPVESEPYRRLVAALPCCNCHRQGRSQAAHVPPDGKSIKLDDRLTFPLCADGPRYRGCHPKFDNYELMPRPKAVKKGLQWAAETREQIDAAGEWPRGLPKYQPPRKKK